MRISIKLINDNVLVIVYIFWSEWLGHFWFPFSRFPSKTLLKKQRFFTPNEIHRTPIKIINKVR